ENGTAFTYNFSSEMTNTASCELFITNVTGDIANGVNTTTLNTTSTIVYNNQTLTQGNDLTWIVNCTWNGTVVMSDDWTFNADATAPTVNLEVGQNHDNWTWTTDTTPTLYYNFTDGDSATASCELFVDGAGYGVNSSVLNNTQTFWTTNASLDVGTHAWYVNCTDLGSNLGTSGTTNNKFYLDVATISLTAPSNNLYVGPTGTTNYTVNGTAFTFNFTSNLVDPAGTENLTNASCELFITNDTGDFANGVNTTVYNATSTTIYNNITLTEDTITWVMNCTYNNSVATSGARTLIVDVSAPTITSTSSTSSSITVTTSEVASCRYSNVAGGYGSMSSVMTGSGTTTHTIGGLRSDLTFYVSCADTHIGNAMTLYSTIRTSSSGSGSGSQGSAGGASSSSTGQFSQKTWASVNKGEKATLNVENGAIGLTDINFVAEDTTYGAWIKAEKLGSLPSSVSAFSKKVYRQIKVSHGNVEKVMKEATMNFKVEKAWLTENSVSKSNVALFRYVGDAWVELPSTVGEDDGTYVHYSATTPGFSYFTIGQKAEEVAVATSEGVETAGELTSPTESLGTTGEEGAVLSGEGKLEEGSAVWPWILGIVVLAVLAGLGYWFVTNHSKPKVNTPKKKK
ncbi:MAG: PGF-pre-PGF domain-containing protein, partial [Candidatus Woesearchaeota archaeon]